MSTNKNLFRDPVVITFSSVLLLLALAAGVYAILNFRLGLSQAAGGHTITLNQVDPNFGDTVNFTLVTTVKEPHVNLICRKGTNIVKAETLAYYGTLRRNFTLSDPTLWPSGGASCTAKLEKLKGNHTTVMATTVFDVAP